MAILKSAFSGLGLIVGLVWIVACTGDDAHGPEAVTAGSPVIETATPVAAEENTEVITPTPTPKSSGIRDMGLPASSVLYTAYFGTATASLEERIYIADVIVRARLESASDGALNFRSIQYLKGSGPKSFTVKADTAGRSTQWDDQDAVLFLMPLSGETEDFEFVDTTAAENQDYLEPRPYTGSLHAGHHINSSNPVWLPVASSSSETGGSSRSSATSSTQSGDPGMILIEYDRDGTPQTLSQADLEAAVSWVSGRHAGASGTSSRRAASVFGQVNTGLGKSPPSLPPRPSSTSPQFTASDVDYCVRDALYTIRENRDYAAYHGSPRPRNEPPVFETRSSAGRGVEVYGWVATTDAAHPISGTQRYSEFWLTGEDSELFRARIVDNDNTSVNGYAHNVINLRPLPAGTYTFKRWGQAYNFKPCNYYKPDAYTVITVRSTHPRAPSTRRFSTRRPPRRAWGTWPARRRRRGAGAGGVLHARQGHQHHRAGVAQRAGGAVVRPDRAALGRPQLHRDGRDRRSVPFPV